MKSETEFVMQSSFFMFLKENSHQSLFTGPGTRRQRVEYKERFGTKPFRVEGEPSER